MDEEGGFVQALLTSPEDPALRPIYADWLEEHGDLRSEYLRLECELAALADEDPRSRDETRLARVAEIEACLQALRPGIQADWLILIQESRREWERSRVRCCLCRRRYAVNELIDISPRTRQKLTTKRYCRTCWEEATPPPRASLGGGGRGRSGSGTGWKIWGYDGYSHPLGHTNSWENAVRVFEEERYWCQNEEDS
jgi:uncharacterized protein (TIGR02996 family)